MKKQYLPLIAAALGAIALASCSGKSEQATLVNQRDTLSWAMGMSLAETAKAGFYDFDKATILKAFESYLNGSEQPLTTDQYNQACRELSFLATAQSRRMNQQQSTDNGKRQEELFAKLPAEHPGIKKAPEGFYYEVLNPGKGPKATVGKRIEFDFKGINMFTGETIEQTYGNRPPVIHVLGSPMFEGLLEGMQLMPAGSKFRFYFPFEKVTGANGIPPYTPVIYEVELHTIYNN